MQLWTDYEGVTIDGVFPLRQLLMPEGRSAFYSTIGPTGEPTVVRLIECHFDEEEILSRWRCVDALNHPNFLKFERFGQTEIDGRPVVYAVLEKVDANLAEVLDRGPLPVKDIAQLASSLVAALDVLHTHGFIHEHVAPANIFAKSGLVKLRSDCIRETPEGEEGRALKQRDVRDLATVLLQGLTQRKSIEGLRDYTMPAPFGQIIRNGFDGTWGLQKIRTTVEDHFGSQQPATPAQQPATPAQQSATPAQQSATPRPTDPAPATAASAEQRPSAAAARPSTRAETQPPLPLRKVDRSAGSSPANARKDHRSGKETPAPNLAPNRDKDQDRDTDQDIAQGFSLRSRWLGTAIVALLLLLSTWVIAHAWNAHRLHAAGTSQSPAQSAPQAATQIGPGSRPRPATGPLPANLPRINQSAPAGSTAGWRVITFTYNRRTDAEKKVSDLAHTHPELTPSVFTPSGHAPYLVSIGGIMDRDAAHALARRSRSLGLPRDTYAQNYRR